VRDFLGFLLFVSVMPPVEVELLLLLLLLFAEPVWFRPPEPLLLLLLLFFFASAFSAALAAFDWPRFLPVVAGASGFVAPI
jgi:hypothetical protein